MTARIIDGKALAREVEAARRLPPAREAVVPVSPSYWWAKTRQAASMSKTKPAPANVPASFQPNTASRPIQRKRSCSN